MIDVIKIIEVMTADSITIYTQVFMSDYKELEEYKCLFTSPLTKTIAE